jgi:hypothetical protein
MKLFRVPIKRLQLVKVSLSDKPNSILEEVWQWKTSDRNLDTEMLLIKRAHIRRLRIGV